MQQISPLADPCPLPNHMKKRSLNEKDKLLYAPMSDIGNVIYDNDVVYISVPQSQIQNRGNQEEGEEERDEEELAEGELMLKRLQNTQAPLDELLEESEVKFFGRSKAKSGNEDMDEEDEDEDDNDDMSEDDEDDEGEEGIDINEGRTKTSKMPWEDDEEEGNEDLHFEDEDEDGEKSQNKRQLSIVSEWESKLNLERSGAASLADLIYGQPTQSKGASLSSFVGLKSSSWTNVIL